MMSRLSKLPSVAVICLLAAFISNGHWANAQDAPHLYDQAKALYLKLKATAPEKTTEKGWLEATKAFKKVYNEFPSSLEAEKALYMVGRLVLKTPKKLRTNKAAQEAISDLQILVDKFPLSSLADDAMMMRARLYIIIDDKPKAKRELFRILETYPEGDMAPTATDWLVKLGDVEAEPEKKDEEEGSKLNKINKIWFTSTETYTRVVIYSSNKVKFSELTFLPGDKKTLAPPRMYMDIMDSEVGKELKRTTPISDGILKQVRVGQFSPDKVRVVLDTESVDTELTKVFPQATEDGGFKIIIDVTGRNASGKDLKPDQITMIAPPKKLDPDTRKEKNPDPKPQPKKEFKRIVIDPGHGGSDPGAVGPKNVKEKNVTLAIALKLEKELKKKLDVEVFLTRRKDKYLPLEERTAFANAKKADIFISIHANSAKRKTARGVETYYLNASTDRAAIRLSALENKTTVSNISEFQEDYKLIIMDLLQTSKAEDSSRLAGHIQKGIVNSLRGKYSDTKDLGVKHALFFVLMGAKMPNVLVEASFISNPVEEKLLTKPDFQKRICQGIVKGVEDFIKEQQKGPVETL